MVAACIHAAGMGRLPYYRDFSIPEHLSSKCISMSASTTYMVLELLSMFI